MLGASGKIPLVWENLLHQKVRTFVGVTGIAFAVILIFTQLGFLGSAEASAMIVYNQLDFDLVLLSREYVRFDQPGFFPPERLPRLLGHRAVERVVPIHIAPTYWHKDRGELAPGDKLNKRSILVIAFPPTDPAFLLPEIVEQQDKLKVPDTVLYDRRSRREFDVSTRMTPDLEKQVYWLGPHGVHIVGMFSLGAGLMANGMVVTSEKTFARMAGLERPKSVSMGLIKLRTGASAEQVADELNDWLKQSTPDVMVWSRATVREEEVNHWIKSMPIGVIFQAGVLVAILVGIVFVYQVISSDISSRVKEFATLKAIGYSDWYLARSIIYQSWLLALFGYLPGLVISFGLYFLAATVAGIPIGLQGERASVLLFRCVGVLAITILLCTVSALFALVKLRTADPADLF